MGVQSTSNSTEHGGGIVSQQCNTLIVSMPILTISKVEYRAPTKISSPDNPSKGVSKAE